MISPYASTWRDAQGEVIRSGWTGTMCRAPLNPRDFAAASEDGEFETVFRCRDCPGCRKFEELQLRKRLCSHFGKGEKQIWVIEYELQSDSRSKQWARLNRALRHECEEGFFRVSSTMIAKLRSGSRPSRAMLRRGSMRATTVYQVSHTASSRGWRRLTRGMLEPREKIGAWQNRYYITGLPQLSGETFSKQLKGGIRKRHPEARSYAQAWRRGLTLYPSEAITGRTVLAELLAKRGRFGSAIHINRPRAQRVSDVLEPLSANHSSPLGRESRNVVDGGLQSSKQSAVRPHRSNTKPEFFSGLGDTGSLHFSKGFDLLWAAVGGRKPAKRGP